MLTSLHPDELEDGGNSLDPCHTIPLPHLCKYRIYSRGLPASRQRQDPHGREKRREGVQNVKFNRPRYASILCNRFTCRQTIRLS